VWVSELLPAIAAALFTAIWGGEPTLLHTVSSFVFVLALFMFGGKLLLSLLTRLTAAVKQKRAYDALLAGLDAQRAAHRDLLNLQSTYHSSRFEIASAMRRLTSVEELDQACERKVHLFMSEVAFARAATRGAAGEPEPAHAFAGGDDQ
jgi:hypothetical protein